MQFFGSIFAYFFSSCSFVIFYYHYFMNTRAIKNFWPNYLSTLLFLGFAYYIYSRSGFHINFINQEVAIGFLNFRFKIQYVFYFLLSAYIIFLIPFYLCYHEESKARVVLWYFKKVLQWNNSFTEKERVSLLAWLVKLFFVPLMVVWLTQHIFSLINNWYALFKNWSLAWNDFLSFFDMHLFGALFASILFFDVLFFTLWYLIEIPRLQNTIKSVEPTLIWWAAAILCYPPFNTFTNDLFGWYTRDHPQFGDPGIHIVMNICILLLMIVYAWASVSLWLKASNLTNRWIVKKWPYKFVRHPAYICKNLAWIIWGIPFVYLAATSTEYQLMTVFLWLWAWTFIYYLRAMTEENHLSADPDYLKYKKEVKYKFIPGIW